MTKPAAPTGSDLADDWAFLDDVIAEQLPAALERYDREIARAIVEREWTQTEARLRHLFQGAQP